MNKLFIFSAVLCLGLLIAGANAQEGNAQGISFSDFLDNLTKYVLSTSVLDVKTSQVTYTFSYDGDYQQPQERNFSPSSDASVLAPASVLFAAVAMLI